MAEDDAPRTSTHEVGADDVEAAEIGTGADGDGFGTRFEARQVDHLHDPSRLGTIARLGLSQAQRDEIFDRASRLASTLLGTEVALVTVVTDDAQHFAGAEGLAALDAEVARTRSTPLSHSLCRSVVVDRTTLSITHGSRDERFADHPAVTELGIEAYLGVPVRDASGATLGSFCVLERRPRDWTDDDVRTLEELGELVRSELLLREQLEQTRYATRMRDDLLRAAAHDLRASVSAIAGAARTIGAGRVTQTAVLDELTSVIVRQSDRTERLLDTLLQRPDQDPTSRQRVAVHELTSAAAQAAALSLAEADRIRLRLDPLWVCSVPEPIERGLLNLIRNALQHTDGEVRIRTGTSGQLAIVEIADDGPGLPEWMRSGDLGNAALLGRASGHGIGVFSAVTLVRSIGGELTYDTSSQGTTFRLLLPDVTDGPVADAPAPGTETGLDAD